MALSRWGTDAEAKELNDDIRGLLRDVLGVTAESGAHFDPAAVSASPSRLAGSDLAALADIVGAGNVSIDDAQRLPRARGKSTPDLLSWRLRPAVDCPDAVVAPGNDDEVAALLEWCGREGVAVVPFGGGTSVVGGLMPDSGGLRAVLSLDLVRFDQLESIDPESGEAVLGAGLTGPRAEELLAEHGFSLGHFPQSFPYATIGGYAMTRSSGQSSAGYGRFDEMVRGLTVVTPVGVIDAGRAPASAAGPDLRQWLLGSEGAFGVCTRVRVRVHPVPETVRHEAFRFPDFAAGAAALRAVEQQGAGPTVIRLSDESETAINLATATEEIGKTSDDAGSGGCLCLCLFEGTADHAESRHAETRAVLLAHGATSLGAGPAESWEHGRFGAPVLRDSLLDNGALVETLETATDWSNIPALRDAVSQALTTSLEESGTPALVMCHISHVYPTGASLYFTVVAGQRGEDPIEQWYTAKRAASEAIVAAGGTITHHHAVGVDHRPYLADEVGEVGVRMLRAVKNAVDPHGVCNPGTLIP
ncbi:FAD-binding oxidoreductase [Dietzia sp. ANT_WB102]|uniref:FAD-binding oxidoreductase n=1 Tax=Dietzia sp. ANT_WB102 TaxID=2597345 RepID=UPI0011EFDC21|nr:FAD-binding oxidoreductase [Dietzia sp. ANT_WB102]KAA0919933.1 FAD-binding oxidoreductase [Dietzia sp. ANT_WB102]